MTSNPIWRKPIVGPLSKGGVLVCFIGLGRFSWPFVRWVMGARDWDEVRVITDVRGRELFGPDRPVVFYDNFFRRRFLKRVEGFELVLDGLEGKDVYITLRSGSGNDHDALIAALRRRKIDFKQCFSNAGKLDVV